MSLRYYDRSGKPITLEQWAVSGDDKIVEQTTIGKVIVSTIWLGLDHSLALHEDAPPLIFETMIFGGEFDRDQWRYTTEEQARAGHEQAVALVRREVKP